MRRSSITIGIAGLLALIVKTSDAIAAGTFYVDAASGACNNSGPGTAAVPYCTISAALTARAGPGTTILVKPAVYREQVTISTAGASGSPLVIQAAGSPVIIDGADDFSSTAKWTLYSGNVWLASSVEWRPKQVFADGARLASSSASASSIPTRSFRYVSRQGLYVNLGGGNPGLHPIFVGRRSYGFRDSGRGWVTFDGFIVTRTEDRAIYPSSTNNITIKNNTVSFGNAYGISISSITGGLVSGNVVSDNNDHGIYLSSATGITVDSNESFRNARPSSSVANGIYLTNSSSNVLQRNRLHDNQDTGLHFQSSSNNNSSVQNLSWNNGDSGFDHVSSTGDRHVNDVAFGNAHKGFIFQSTSTGGSLANCIAVNNGLNAADYDLWLDSGSTTGFGSDDNIFWNSNGQAPVQYSGVTYATVAAYASATGRDTRSLQADPRFAGGATGNFHLASGSPAIDDANSSVTDWPATNDEGKARTDDPATSNTGLGPVPFADRGAYEYVPTGPVDHPPVVTAPVTQSGSEGASISFTVTASDPDGQAIASLGASGLPTGAQFQADPGNASGTFSWTPGFTDGRAAPYNVTFTATNALSGSATTAITVNNIDRPPVVTAPSSAGGNEGAAISFTVTASDPDNDPITSLAAVGMPVGAQFTPSADKKSGTFTWTPGFDQGRADPYTVTFTATNAKSGNATTAITVNNVDRAPSVSAPATMTVVADSSMTFQVTASDPDGDPIVSLSADLSAFPTTNPPAFAEDPSHQSGTLTWIPGPNEIRTAPYNVTFTATNAQTGSATTAIRVRNVDQAPVVTAPANASGAENSVITVNVSASDPDGDPVVSLTANLSGLPNGNNAVFTMTAQAAGTLTWTPTFNDSRATPYSVTFTASNARSGSSITQISVTNTNRLPTAALSVSPPSGPSPLSVTADASASSDPDGPIASYTFDFGDGTVVGPQPGSTAPHTYATGVWSASVTVADGDGATATASRSVTAGNVGQPPVASFSVAPGAPYPGFITMVTDSSLNVSVPQAPRPAYLVPTQEPTFHTKVTRITDIAGNPFTTATGSGTWGADARHHYSKDQPWSSDGSLIEVQNSNGSPSHVYLDGETYQVRYGLCPNYGYNDDRWHPSPQHPHERINANGNELMWFDVTTCTKTRSWTLPFSVDGLGQGEGNASLNGRFVALSDSRRVFVVDMDPQPPLAPYPSQRIGPAFDFSNCGISDCTLGWVSISPSGKYVVVKYNGDHPRVLDVDPTTLALTPRPMPASSPRCSGGSPAQGYIYDLGHADMTLNPFDNNEDVLIGQEHCGNRGLVVGGQLIGGVVMVRLRDGAMTSLTDPTNEAYPHHISTRNLDRPGWAYVGYNTESGKRFSDEILAVKLDGSKSVQRFAHKHSAYSSCYRCESHAVPSRDGRRVIWASNWAQNCTICGSTSEIKDYVVDARIPTHGDTLGRAPLMVTADASASRDPDGTIASYQFDFGDGTVVGPQPGPIATHTYATGGWTASLTVTDNAGRTASTTSRFTVAQPNQSPNGQISSPAGNVSISTGQSVSFTATVSDPDNDVPLTYQWDFGGGAPNQNVKDPGSVVFNTAGSYTVTFTVTDALGLADPTPDTRVVTVTTPSPAPLHDEIHWSFVGPTSVTFDWRGTENTIQYGYTSAYGLAMTASTPSPLPFSSSGPFWEAKLTGLQENTVYHYAIGTGPDHTFRTPPARGSSNFTVYVEGDIGSILPYPRVGAVQSLIAADLPTFVLAVGDLTYGDDKGQASVDQHFNDVMVWSQDAAYMACWGNHEWGSPDDMRNYKGRLDFPNPQTSPGAPTLGCCGEDWSWFDYGNVRFISYPEPYSGAWADWSPKAASLMDAAQNDPAIRFIVTFGHRPAYSSGYHAGDTDLQGYLGALGASHSKYVLNLNGHSHDYERSYPQSGVTHVTVGTGGSSLEESSGSCIWPGGCPPPPWSAFRVMHHGALKLNFTPTGIDAHMICGPAGDTGSNKNDITCTQGSEMDAFLIGTVADVPPVVTAPANVGAVPDAPLTINVTALDPNVEAINSLSADLTNLPQGSNATFLPNGTNTAGTLTWTPTASDLRSAPYTVTFTAANALSGSTTTSITVSHPPVVNTTPPNPSGDENTQTTVSVTASDPDGDAINSLTANLTGLPAGNNAVFTQDPSHATGTLTWTPTYNDGRATPYTVTFTASNALSGSTSTTITVRNVDRPPVVTAPATITAVANTAFTLTATAADPDGDPITTLGADLSNLPSGATFTSNAAHTVGTLNWTPSSADVRPNPYSVTFTATNALSGSATTAITVAAANQPPTARLSVTPSSGSAPLSVTADASASTDDGSIASYRFDFGDGTVVGPQPSATATHSYSGGTWNATVTVTDNIGATSTSAPVTVSVTSNNLCGNPSFESGTTGWSAYGGSTIAQVSGGYDGAFCLEMRGPTSSSAEFGVNDSPNWVASTGSVGSRYRFGAWARSAAGVGSAKLRVREYLSGTQKGTTTYSAAVPLTTSWQRVTVDYVTTTAGSNLDLQILDYPTAAGQIYQADAVSIELVPAAAAKADTAAIERGTRNVAPPQPAIDQNRFEASVSPEPIRSEGTLNLTIGRPGLVSAELLDLDGRRVRMLMDHAYVPAGRHALGLDGRNDRGQPLPSGVYFYRIRAPQGTLAGRLVIMR